MSHNDTLSPEHGQDDEQSRRWSTDTVASTSLEARVDDERTDPSHQITEKTLSHIPRGYNVLETGIATSAEANFHERQINCAAEETHLTTKHASALTLSLQQCSDIISCGHSQVDSQADMLAGLQMHMKPNPPAASPADLRADLEVNHWPDPSALPPIPVDEDDNADVTDLLESAYATAYRLRAPGAFTLDSGVADTMRREAAMDDAIFRPRLTPTRTPACERRRGGEYMNRVVIQKHVRKRKRGEKDTD